VGIVITMANSEASRLVLRNDVAELKRLAGWIEGFTEQRTSPDVSFAAQLCLEEAVANIIMYWAARGDPPENAVELERNGANLGPGMEDSGRQSDPPRAPPPVQARSLEEAKVGAVGIHLMRSFATGINYERRNGRNRLPLRFVKPPVAPAE